MIITLAFVFLLLCLATVPAHLLGKFAGWITELILRRRQSATIINPPKREIRRENRVH